MSHLKLHLGRPGWFPKAGGFSHVSGHASVPRMKFEDVWGIWMFPKIGYIPPKSSIFIGFSIINHPFWGTIICGNTYIDSGRLFFCCLWKHVTIFPGVISFREGICSTFEMGFAQACSKNVYATNSLSCCQSFFWFMQPSAAKRYYAKFPARRMLANVSASGVYSQMFGDHYLGVCSLQVLLHGALLVEFALIQVTGRSGKSNWTGNSNWIRQIQTHIVPQIMV